MAKEQKKKNADCNQVILDHFWTLSEKSEDKRCRSVQVILKTLNAQVEKENEKNDILYCLKRLIKGLASNNEFARHGYCVLLTRLLAQFPEHLAIDEVLELTEKEYGAKKGKKLENLDSEYVIAWTLLLGCLAKSQRLHKETRPEPFTRVWSALWTLGLGKPYVEIIICSVLDIFYDAFGENEKLFNQVVLSPVKENDGGDKNMIFLTYVVLLARQKFPKSAGAFANEFISTNLYKLGSTNYKKVASLIKETTKYTPNLHPTVEMLLSLLIQLEPANASKLCPVLIEVIFKDEINKFFLGFNIVKIILKQVKDPEMVPSVLTNHFLTRFIQALSSKQNPLHNAAIELGNYLAEYSQQHREHGPEMQLALVHALTTTPGSINFDEQSHSKVLSNITKHFGDEATKSWVKTLTKLMLEQESIPTTDFYRVQCMQQLVHCLKSYTRDDEVLWKVNRFLFVYAYFDRATIEQTFSKKIVPKFQHPVSDRLQDLFVDDFKNLFAHQLQLSFQSKPNPVARVAAQVASVQQFVQFIGKELLSKKFKLISNKVEPSKFVDTWKRVEAGLEALPKTENIQVNIFKLLTLCFMVEMFENFDEICQILPDFEECAKRALSEGDADNKKKKAKSKQNKQEEEPAWADVLTELLLSQLASKSKYMKNIITMTFKQIVTHLTPVGVGTLIDAIGNEKGVFDAEDDDDEEEDEEMEEANGDVDMNGDDDGEAEDEEDEDEEEDDEEEEDNEDIADDETEVVDEQFKKDVHKALGKAAMKSVDQDGDEDDDEDDDDVSDSEMFKLDKSLAEIFRAKFGNTKKAKAERDGLMQTFMVNVLDLIGIVLDFHKHLSVELLAELTQAVMELTRVNQALKVRQKLTAKCCTVLGRISKYKTDDDAQKISSPTARALFLALINFLRKNIKPEVSKALMHTSKWLVDKSDDDLGEHYLKVVHTELKNFFAGANHIPPAFFNQIISQLCHMTGTLFVKSAFYETLIEQAFREDIRPFQRGSALIILTANINKAVDDTTDLAYRTDKQMLVEMKKGTNQKKVKGKQQAKNEFHLPYLNHLIKLWLLIDAERLSSLKELRAAFDQLNPKTKKQLKSTQKRFTQKLKA